MGFTLRKSNFKKLIGFAMEIIRESGFGTKAPNITNDIDTLYIHCDITSNSIVDGRYSNPIYTVNTADLTRSYPIKKKKKKKKKKKALKILYCFDRNAD